MEFEYLLNEKVKIPIGDIHKNWIIENNKLSHNNYHNNKIYKYLSKNKVAIDVGAFIGTMSDFYALHSHYVYSFEPNVDSFNCLEYNMKQHKNIELHNVALSDKEEYLKSNIVETNYGMNYLEPSTKKTKIKSKTLDSFNIKNVGYIKIDAELMEMNVLKGALNTISENICYLDIEINDNLIEYRNPGYSSQELIDYVCSLGYRVVDTIGKIGQRDLIFKPNKLK